MATTPGSAPDPRHIITPDAFRVDPTLLGLPLAGAIRRALAMAVDGLIIAFLSAGPSILFGVAAAALLFRISGRPAPGSGYLRRSARAAARVTGAIVTFGLAVSLWGGLTGGDDTDDDRVTTLTGMEGIEVGIGMLALQGQNTPEDAREVLEEVVPSLRRGGMSDSELRQMLLEMAEVPGREWYVAIADSIVPDTTGTAGSGEPVADTLPSAMDDSIGALITRLTESRAREAELATRVQQLESDEAEDDGSPILGFLAGLADDLGLGIGWGGLYFTAFLTLWKGRTPGKRLLGVRVIQLNGQPLGWWASFGRFGGYAAGLATGLLGFAQVFWDRNRQMVHDKISETVVIREPRS